MGSYMGMISGLTKSTKHPGTEALKLPSIFASTLAVEGVVEFGTRSLGGK